MTSIKEADDELPKERRLYIGPIGLNWMNDTEDLVERLEKYGSVTKPLEIHRKPLADEGFGFVSISLTKEAYSRLLGSLKGTKYRGSILRIEESKPDYQQRMSSLRKRSSPSKVAKSPADHNVIAGRIRKSNSKRLKNATYRCTFGDKVVELRCKKKKLWGVCRNREKETLVWRYSNGHWIDGRGEIVDSSKILTQMRFPHSAISKPIKDIDQAPNLEKSDPSDLDIELPDQHQEEQRNLKILDSLLSMVDKDGEDVSGPTRQKETAKIISFDDEDAENSDENKMETSSSSSSDGEDAESSGKEVEAEAMENVVETKHRKRRSEGTRGKETPKTVSLDDEEVQDILEEESSSSSEDEDSEISDEEMEAEAVENAVEYKHREQESEGSRRKETPKTVSFDDEDVQDNTEEESSSSSEDEDAESSDEEVEAEPIVNDTLENNEPTKVSSTNNTIKRNEAISSSNKNSNSLTEKLRSVFAPDDAGVDEGQSFFFFDENKQDEEHHLQEQIVVSDKIEPPSHEISTEAKFSIETSNNDLTRNKQRIPLLFPHKDSPFLSSQTIFASLMVDIGENNDNTSKDDSRSSSFKGFDPQRWQDEFYEKRGEWNREFRRRHRDNRRRIQKSGMHASNTER